MANKRDDVNWNDTNSIWARITSVKSAVTRACTAIDKLIEHEFIYSTTAACETAQKRLSDAFDFASSSTTGGAIWNPKLEMLQLAKQPASRSFHMRTSISLLCRSWPVMSRSILHKHKHLLLSPRPATHRPLQSFLRASSFSRKNY